MKYALLLALLLAGTGCGEFYMPAERTAYDIACRTAKADTTLPLNAVIHPIADAEIGVCVNMARVDLPYDVVTAAGTKETRVYTVWLKRIARRWELDRIGPPEASGPTALTATNPAAVAR